MIEQVENIESQLHLDAFSDADVLVGARIHIVNAACQENVVLHARAKKHRVDDYAGPLSIKTVLAGEVAWLVGGRKLVVDSSSFLILSAGERYSMNIDAASPVETCCVFFSPGFVEGVARDLTSSVADALDAPRRDSQPLPYLSALHTDEERALSGRVQGLASRCRYLLAPIGFEEDFLNLANDLLHHYAMIRDQVARLGASRAATRAELFRRLLRGREFIHAQPRERVSLADMAQAACLSSFHFHRGFRKAFGVTPHAYVTNLRLERARKLIERGWRVIEACFEVGFESPSAFSRVYRSRFGETPGAARRKFARSGRTDGENPGRMAT